MKKPKLHKQEKSYSCAAACLRMVLEYYGIIVDEGTLRIKLKTKFYGTHPINMRHSFYGVIIALVSFVACTKNDAYKQQGIEELSFSVNQSLLGSVYKNHELGFSFSPPLGWEKMPQETVEQAKKQLEQITKPTAGVKVNLEQFFLDQKSGASCVVSRLSKISSDSLGMLNLDAYKSNIVAKFSNSEVREGQFVLKNFLVHQILVMSANTVSFKLIFPRSSEKSFQLDYVVPRAVYEENVEVIESSIGSLSSLD